MRRAFTLMELLVVVAIISILAVIAMPNYLDAQVRSKVAAAKNNMRSIATKIEMYHVDYGKYPLGFTRFFADLPSSDGNIGWLMSPNYGHILLGNVATHKAAYEGRCLDPFFNPSYYRFPDTMGGLVYFNHQFLDALLSTSRGWFTNYHRDDWRVASELAGAWSLHSVGPAAYTYRIVYICGPGFTINAVGAGGGPRDNYEAERKMFQEYDPTNGTISHGCIFRTQRNPAGLGCHKQFYKLNTDE